MQNELICTKVISLLSLYIDGKLSLMQKEFVDEHLKHCSKCREKYNNLKNLLHNLKHNYPEKIQPDKNKSNTRKNNFEYSNDNLSAYFDNELPFEESVKLKKYIMKMPLAREELKKVYELQKLLHKNLENTRKKMPYDFSKIIIQKINTTTKTKNITLWSKTAALIITILICISLVGVFYYAKHAPILENLDKIAIFK